MFAVFAYDGESTTGGESVGWTHRGHDQDRLIAGLDGRNLCQSRHAYDLSQGVSASSNPEPDLAMRR
jgi:hypothetical protein